MIIHYATPHINFQSLTHAQKFCVTIPVPRHYSCACLDNESNGRLSHLRASRALKKLLLPTAFNIKFANLIHVDLIIDFM